MTARRPPVPTPVAIYGALGLIPFWAPTAIAWARPELTDPMKDSLAIYAALILSFLGGARWAFAVARSAPSAWTVTFSMLPTLAGFGLMLSPRAARLPGLAVALAAMGAWDLRPGDPPPWYPRLRIPLTLAAVGGVVLGAVVMR